MKNVRLKSLLAPDLRNTFFNNLWSIVKGPVTVLLIPLFLSENAQGFWYTFGSLAALSTLADLGFTTIVAQFSAHEYAHLDLKNKIFTGEEEHLARLASLLRYVLRWASVVAFFAFPIIFTVGIITFNTTDVQVVWLAPWTFYVFASGINFIMGVLLSFFEGCGQLDKIQSNRLMGSIIATGVTWSVLVLNMELYALALGAIAGLIINLLLLMARFKKPIRQLFKIKNNKSIKWNKDFLGLIWKYAISWASGYLVFQIYTPLAFLYYDPVSAGKVGITMTLCQACYVLATVWITISVPKINMSAAKKDWKRMDSLLKKSMLLSIVTMLIGIGIGAFLLLYLKGKWSIVDRFMDFPAIMMLLFTWLFQIAINAFAVYGRAHKREPFMVPSIVSSALTVAGTFLSIYFLPINYMFIGFGGIAFIFMFVFAYIYFKNKNKWHDDLSLKIDLEDKLFEENRKTRLDEANMIKDIGNGKIM
jgi:O-antigen/teichoic acid export membrane protein